MIVLGLHFGHDASVAIVKDGELLLCYERERSNRIKHAMTLTAADIETCMADVGLTLEQIDYVTLTSTQLVEFIFVEPEALSIRLGKTDRHGLPCSMVDILGVDARQMHGLRSGWLQHVLEDDKDHPYKHVFPDIKAHLYDDKKVFGGFEHFIDTPIWHDVVRLEDIKRCNYSEFIEKDDVSQGFHYPATLVLNGLEIPAYIFEHHYAHLAYSFYSSPYEEAALLSHDGGGGGGGYACGLFGFGKGNRIYPLTPHHLALGETYDFSGVRVGFDIMGAAGKLMGLSAYGKPRFFDRRFVGNWHDTGRGSAQDWIAHCEREAERQGYDVAMLGRSDRPLDPVNVDFAASTQHLIEEGMLAACESLNGALTATLGRHVPSLCLSGGLALNCPANTRIWNESVFTSVHVPPAVSDAGLSIGSALALYHNMLGNPRTPRETGPRDAYLGLHGSAAPERIGKAIETHATRLVVEHTPNGAERAAQDLFENKVIAWFEGRSEVGPRALGHRSILANPAYPENWERVNRIKQRETWRPFAPAVLSERCDDFFTGTQTPAFFMLLNATVKVDSLPAITHADRSARIQSVTPDCGRYYDLIQAFERLSGTGVVLNTSFNGPGEPIVETPDEAIAFLLRTEIDALYFGDLRLCRSST